MVGNVATVGRNGVHDFILIRASAVILALYTFLILGFFLVTPQVTYDVWREFFACVPVKIFTVIATLALLVHAWIGVWQVLSDYVKSTALRGSLQFIFAVTLLTYFVSAILIVWGV